MTEQQIMMEPERRLYLTSDIDEGSIVPLVRAINEINDYDETIDEMVITGITDFVEHGIVDIDAITLPERKPIILEINTGGGIVNYGFQLITAIENSKTPVIGYVTGQAMSMGIPILTSCDVRIGTKYSRYMMHDIFIGTQGKLSESRSWLQSSDIIASVYEEIIANTTKMTKEEVHEIHTRNHDYLFMSEQALELGLIDFIDDGEIDQDDVLSIMYGKKEVEDDQEEEDGATEPEPNYDDDRLLDSLFDSPKDEEQQVKQLNDILNPKKDEIKEQQKEGDDITPPKAKRTVIIDNLRSGYASGTVDALALLDILEKVKSGELVL